ncbi:MAG: hypothetical protein V1728_05690 [Candidatus Micrarchaeota archaeon]
MSNLINMVEGWKTTLLALGPSVSVILIVLGGLLYGVSQTQPAQMRGKWQSTAAGLIVGGVIVAVITAAAQTIAQSASTVLLP